MLLQYLRNQFIYIQEIVNRILLKYRKSKKKALNRCYQYEHDYEEKMLQSNINPELHKSSSYLQVYEEYPVKQPIGI